MTEKKEKRAVIISNIRSNSIEQAIFILKASNEELGADAGSIVVAEAQDIINSYIRRIEGSMPSRYKSRVRKKFIAVGVFLLSILATAAVFTLFKR